MNQLFDLFRGEAEFRQAVFQFSVAELFNLRLKLCKPVEYGDNQLRRLHCPSLFRFSLRKRLVVGAFSFARIVGSVKAADEAVTRPTVVEALIA